MVARLDWATGGGDLEQAVSTLILGVVRALVTDEDAVRAHLKTGETASTFLVSVAPKDLAAVIGRQGMTARAIRNLLAGLSAKLNHRFAVEFDDGDKGSPTLVLPTDPNPEKS